MKRTAYIISNGGRLDDWTLSKEKITCTVCGEMADGVKVWRDIKTGEQYGLMRLLGKFCFYKF